MTRWIDGSDWSAQRAKQRARLPGSEYRDDAEIELLLGVCDIRVGLLPTINQPEVKWFIFAKSLHSEGVLGVCSGSSVAREPKHTVEQLQCYG